MKIGKLRMCLIGDDMLTQKEKTLMNIGDAVQGVAMSGIYKYANIRSNDIILLPRFSLLKSFSNIEDIVLPYGSSFGSTDIDITFPFPSCIYPVFLSVNVDNDFFTERLDLVQYFKEHEPIGCRDEKSRNYFRKYGIKAYLMGCYTLSLDKPEKTCSESIGKTIFVDLSKNALDAIPDSIKTDAESISHSESLKEYPVTEYEDDRLYEIAKKNLSKYSQAKLVVTSRLHVAAPCVAMGIPVVLMQDNIDYRFEFIDKYIPVYQLPDYKSIDWDNIVMPNPNDVNFAKSKIRELYKTVLLQKPYEDILCELDAFYMNRNRFEPYKLFRNKLKTFYKNAKNFSYAIYGAGVHCSFIYELMQEMYPEAKLVCIFDKYKRGQRYGVDIISPDTKRNDFSSAIITTARGKDEALSNLTAIHKLGGGRYSSAVLNSYAKNIKQNEQKVVA
ncbi:MAG: polysaccharide pyruvyl transferase family protein [Treponema sp.]